MDGLTGSVAENLDLDVARALEVLLHIQLVIAECRHRLRGCGCERLLHVFGRSGDLDSPASAAGRGLDQDRVADLSRDPGRLLRIRNRPVGTRNAIDSQLRHRPLGGDLVAHDPDVIRSRSDEGYVVILKHLHEVGVLGQETVSRMDRVGLGDVAGRNDCGNGQVAHCRLRRAYADRLVRHSDMHGIVVRGGVNRDARDAELLAGPDDPQCNFAPVGNEDLGNHLRGSLLDDHQRGSVLDHRIVLDQDSPDRSRPGGVDLVHGLHGFDDQQGLAFLDRPADLHEFRGTRLGLEIDRANHGGDHGAGVIGQVGIRRFGFRRRGW